MRRGRPVLVYGLGGLVLIAAWICGVVLLGGDPERAPEDSARAAQYPAEGPRAVEGTPVRSGDGSAQPEAPEGGESTPQGGATTMRGERGASEPAPVEERPASYDPLGTGAKPGDLSKVDVGRVRDAATDYVTYGFGYSGNDKQQYLDGFYATVFATEFGDYDKSPGAKAIDSYAEAVENGGTRGTAFLEDFRLVEQGPEEAEADVRFRIESPAGKARYEQRLSFRRYYAQWKVLYAQELKEVE